MKTPKANPRAVARNIARILRENPRKVEELSRVRDITVHLTSDDGLRVTVELYRDHVVRFLIRGTRSGMTLTADVMTCILTRKRRNEKPWLSDDVVTCAGDIFRALDDITRRP